MFELREYDIRSTEDCDKFIQTLCDKIESSFDLNEWSKGFVATYRLWWLLPKEDNVHSFYEEIDTNGGEQVMKYLVYTKWCYENALPLVRADIDFINTVLIRR